MQAENRDIRNALKCIPYSINSTDTKFCVWIMEDIVTREWGIMQVHAAIISGLSFGRNETVIKHTIKYTG